MITRGGNADAVSSRNLGAASVVAAAVLWGLWPLWVRLGTGGPSTAAIGLLVAGVVGSPLAVLGARARSAPARPSSAWLLLGLLGVFDGANAWCYFRALAEGAVAPAVLSHYLAPAFVALAGPLVLAEARSRRTPLALALSLGGTIVLVAGQHSLRAPGVAAGLLLGGASAVFYAGYVLLAKHLARSFSDLEIMAHHALVAGVLLSLLTPLPSSLSLVLFPVVGGLVSALGAGLLFCAGLRRVPAQEASLLTYIEPLAAVCVGWLGFGEALTWPVAFGGACILVAGYLVATEPKAD